MAWMLWAVEGSHLPSLGPLHLLTCSKATPWSASSQITQDSAEGSHILKPVFIKALHHGRSAQCSVTFPSISPLHHLVQPCRSDGRRADSKVTAPLLIFIHSLLFLLQIEFRKLSWIIHRCKFTSIQLLEIKAQMPSV